MHGQRGERAVSPPPSHRRYAAFAAPPRAYAVIAQTRVPAHGAKSPPPRCASVASISGTFAGGPPRPASACRLVALKAAPHALRAARSQAPCRPAVASRGAAWRARGRARQPGLTCRLPRLPPATNERCRGCRLACHPCHRLAVPSDSYPAPITPCAGRIGHLECCAQRAGGQRGLANPGLRVRPPPRDTQSQAATQRTDKGSKPTRTTERSLW